MSEEPGKYTVDTDTADAMEMLGKGYSHPATVIEPPRRVLERNNGRDFEEQIRPAWIKFSTAFKDELPDISGNALKVWIFIALSVNYQGEAFPGIMTIAKGIGISHPTVMAAINELESLNILTVRRGEKRHNIYHVSNDYVTMGKAQPLKNLSSSDHDHESFSPDYESFSANHERRVSSNKKELEEQEVSRKEKKSTTLLEGSDPAWLIAGGVASSEIAAQSEKMIREKSTADLWEREMGYNPLPWWDDRKLGKLLAFLLDKSPADVHTFAEWSKRQFSTFSPTKARQYPEQVIEFWLLAVPPAKQDTLDFVDQFAALRPYIEGRKNASSTS